MIAWLNLRHSVPERSAAFTAGLQRIGYSVRAELTMRPGPRDILVTWNRIREGHPVATQFEREGCRVLVTENASWGNDFAGQRWYTLCNGYHNTQQRVPALLPDRWGALGVELQPWRTSGQTVILPSRGIGPPGVAMPLDWTRRAVKRYGGRVREHPGRGVEAPIEWDLKHAGRAITWGSGAAIKALMLGIPVTSEMPRWIGEQDNTDAGRLAMFQRLAWSQWTLKEFENGSAFAHALNRLL